jgi:hypothetical protein
MDHRASLDAVENTAYLNNKVNKPKISGSSVTRLNCMHDAPCSNPYQRIKYTEVFLKCTSVQIFH